MSSATFLFVDGANKPNRATLRQIRSHAMIGKNAGRILPPRRRRAATKEKDRLPTSCDAQTPLGSVLVRTGHGLENGMRACRFPLALAPASLEVVTKYFYHISESLFPPRLGVCIIEYRRLWMQTLLADEAALHCGLVLMEACNDFFCGHDEAVSPTTPATLSTNGLRHLNQALALVNARLASDAALQDATFGLVVMLIMHEHIRRKQAVAEIHFQGLARMVELRGGIDQLGGYGEALVLKICKLDLCSSWQSGRPMHFFRNRMATAREHMDRMGLGRYWRPSAGKAPRPASLCPALVDVLDDASHLAGFLNTAPADGHYIRVSNYHEVFVSLSSRLAHLQLSGRGVVAVIDMAYHLGLTLFCMTLFLQVNSRCYLTYTAADRRLCDIFGGEVTGYLDPALRLWLLLLAQIWGLGDGAASTDKNKTDWLRDQLWEAAQQLGLGIASTWADVHRAVSVLPWVDALHDDQAQRVWNNVVNDNRFTLA